MGRIAGIPNKITTEVRGKLQNLIEGLINSIQIEDLKNNQKIKRLQIALQYTMPRLQASLITTEREDLPLFIEDIYKECQMRAKYLTKVIFLHLLN